MSDSTKPSLKINLSLSLITTMLLWVPVLAGAWLLPMAADVFYDNPYYVTAATFFLSFAFFRIISWD